MTDLDELIRQLSRMKVQTGSLVCLGCGLEHNCGIHGCAVLRRAVSAVRSWTNGGLMPSAPQTPTQP